MSELDCMPLQEEQVPEDGIIAGNGSSLPCIDMAGESRNFFKFRPCGEKARRGLKFIVPLFGGGDVR
jgi:hypothetical protein